MKKFIYKICKISEWNSAQKKKFLAELRKILLTVLFICQTKVRLNQL